MLQNAIFDYVSFFNSYSFTILSAPFCQVIDNDHWRVTAGAYRKTFKVTLLHCLKCKFWVQKLSVVSGSLLLITLERQQ